MATNPIFQAPEANPPTTRSAHADIIKVDAALESMRESGFDITAAIGEPIDNSIEAGANLVRVVTTYGPKKKAIDKIAIADNGSGIDLSTLPNVLSMGFSTRYGKRTGLGRYGVGMKLAGLSLGRRIDVYTKQANTPQIRHSYISLKEIGDGTQTYITADTVDAWPEDYAGLMIDRDGEPVRSGTLVIYGEIDRLTSGGTYSTSLQEQIDELRTFIARAYRKFLGKGLVIELNEKSVSLYDPLFLMDNPRIIERYGPRDIRGIVIDEDDIEIVKGQKIHVTVTIAPEEFRKNSGDGGLKDSDGRDIREFHIPSRAGKISMLRNQREINFDMVAKLLPGGVDKVDRYIGIEVSFPAALDEYFQVRNVKRGAVPVDKLRQTLRKWLEQPVRQARAQIRKHWDKVEAKEQVAATNNHGPATEAVQKAEQTAPPGQAGQNVTPEQSKELVNSLIEQLSLDPETEPEKVAVIEEQIEANRITMVDGTWPPPLLFDIDHLNSGKAVLKLNRLHPFVRDVYKPIKQVAAEGLDDLNPEEFVALARKTTAALDILLMAYTKAENMHAAAPDQFQGLRLSWGIYAQDYLAELDTDTE